MSSVYKFHDGLHPICILQSLFELQNTGSLCDVTLVVNGDEIRAHKAVLASASPYFRAMFTSGLTETMQDHIVLHEMEFPILRDIISFFYTGHIDMTEENVYVMLEMADFLQVSALQAACSHYLLSALSASNCLSVYVRASLRGDKYTAYRVFRYLLLNFKAVMEEEDFVLMPPEALLKVLSSQLLNISHEGQLLEGVIRWWKHDHSERFKYLKPLISKISLEQVPMELLLSFKSDPLLADTELLSQIKQTENFILELRYEKRDIKALWDICHKKSLWKGRYGMEQEVILAIGGESSGIALGSVECLTSGYDSWKCIVPTYIHEGEPCEETRVIPTMHHARFCAAVTARDYEVFVIGGTNSSSILDMAEYYSIQSNVWCDLARLPVAVLGAGAVFLNDQLYVVGGKGKTNYENRTWVYEEHHNTWHEVCPMIKRRAHHGVVAVGGAIYTIGGASDDGDGKDTYLKCMERYDHGRSRWFAVAPMHEKRASFGCAALGEFIYVMGGNGGEFWLKAVERYDTLTNQWSYMAPMSVPRSNFSTTVYNNRIYCMGGHDSVHYLNSVEKFNPNTNRWHCVNSMQVRRFGMGAATLFVPFYKQTL